MPDIDDITASLQARAEELRGAVGELAAVEAALAALQGGTERAPRGSVKARLVAVVAESPGLKASEIAHLAGIAPAGVYVPLKALLEAGTLQRDESKRWSATAAREEAPR
ncbi:MAG: hypothetical protein Q7T55_25470 [Solirubrobacteraceae bacterium]|nr:hypothetical protein [Solirubrobacteraceae bacterium]